MNWNLRSGSSWRRRRSPDAGVATLRGLLAEGLVVPASVGALAFGRLKSSGRSVGSLAGASTVVVSGGVAIVG